MYTIYFLKIIAFLYLKNVIEKNGLIIMNDIGVLMGMNSILYYVITVLGDIRDDMNIFFSDLIVQSICFGIYANILEEKNNKSINHVDAINEESTKECKLMNITPKPIQPDFVYPKMRIVALILFTPYYLLFV